MQYILAVSHNPIFGSRIVLVPDLGEPFDDPDDLELPLYKKLTYKPLEFPVLPNSEEIRPYL